jgi:hypothetical protein
VNKKTDPMTSLHGIFVKEFKSDSTKQRLVAAAGGNARIQRVIGEIGTPVVLQVTVGGQFYKAFLRTAEEAKFLKTSAEKTNLFLDFRASGSLKNRVVA